MRLFVALWPSRAERTRLAALAGRLAGGDRRALPAADLHLTLAFLGEVAPARLVPLARWLVRQPSPLPAVLVRLEAWQGGRVLVAAGEPSARLRAARQRMLRALRALGCRPDPRPFAPHVTLARSLRGSRAAAGAGVGGRLAPPLRLEGRRLALVASGLPAAGRAGRYPVLALGAPAAGGRRSGPGPAYLGGCTLFRAGILPYMY